MLKTDLQLDMSVLLSSEELSRTFVLAIFFMHTEGFFLHTDSKEELVKSAEYNNIIA